jgi:hypothetical protein
MARLKGSKAVRNRKLARAALSWDTLPNFFAITMDDPAGDTPLRRGMALVVLPIVAWYLVNELFLVGTQSIEYMSVPSRLMYDLQNPPKGGQLKSAVDNLWARSLPEEDSSWSGAANAVPEVPLELTLYGSAGAHALVIQSFSPYSRCTEHLLDDPPTFNGLPSFTSEIHTSVASGESLVRYRQGGDPWQSAPFSTSIERSMAGCDQCDSNLQHEPSGAMMCDQCWTRMRVKLCGDAPTLFGNDLTRETYISVRLPIEHSNTTFRVGMRPTRTGCFGSGVCTGDPMKVLNAAGENVPIANVAVQPYERVLLRNELRLNLNGNWEGDHGAYGVNPLGTIFFGVTDTEGTNGPCDSSSPPPDSDCDSYVASAEGSELRLTMGDVTLIRTIDRWQEILGLIGGFFGTVVLALGVVLDLIEKFVSMRKAKGKKGEAKEVEGQAVANLAA